MKKLRVRYKAMMGEFIIYYKDKVVGGIYDDRLLVKETESGKKLISNIKYELPYVGGKEMILVEEIEDKIFLKNLFECMYNELTVSKKRKWKVNYMVY